ncbi:hypothetical protein PC116_g8593 [Phytophthora cactorum]|uniref:Uncharacterized protein n=1 Tax=Phytophthora cactorum TaxID=29920 RepID=A0A8T1E532_9STRA|nr:hypothetical protein Pcac1_g20732 [Phytophthora cactorum]KAG2948588.1 hypothetical protein PC117_g5891 [Phytophthora cactorum]KAG3023455.1 hypothetical protein PC120_g7567 [Phytophthora cactorum]KAG3181712.1 hypothetical protein C6341_g6295 [Phytophthora cactorum]KAG4243541.1 hypothetical protein PC116_g8593 [Phytophthora cactorum]
MVAPSQQSMCGEDRTYEVNSVVAVTPTGISAVAGPVFELPRAPDSPDLVNGSTIVVPRRWLGNRRQAAATSSPVYSLWEGVSELAGGRHELRRS